MNAANDLVPDGADLADVKTWAEKLEALPVLASGQTADLHVDSGRLRVWLARTGLADGEPFEQTVYVEVMREDYTWAEVGHYDAAAVTDWRLVWPRTAQEACEATREGDGYGLWRDGNRYAGPFASHSEAAQALLSVQGQSVAYACLYGGWAILSEPLAGQGHERHAPAGDLDGGSGEREHLRLRHGLVMPAGADSKALEAAHKRAHGWVTA